MIEFLFRDDGAGLSSRRPWAKPAFYLRIQSPFLPAAPKQKIFQKRNQEKTGKHVYFGHIWIHWCFW